MGDQPRPDPEVLRGRLAEARAALLPTDRAVQIYFAGSRLCSSDDAAARAEGLAALIEAAALASPDAAFEAGMHLVAGDCNEADPERGLALLRQASDAGLTAATNRLAQILLPMRGSGPEIVRRLEAAVKAGDWESHHLFGLLRFRGGVVSKDLAEARRLQRLAAEHGVREAQLELSLLLAQGIGGPVEEAEAAEWERRAAEAGEPRACLNMGSHAALASPPRFDEAVTWYERAAEAGSSEAAARLARMFGAGLDVEEDLGRSQYWFVRAAELGYDWNRVLTAK